PRDAAAAVSAPGAAARRKGRAQAREAEESESLPGGAAHVASAGRAAAHAHPVRHGSAGGVVDVVHRAARAGGGTRAHGPARAGPHRRPTLLVVVVAALGVVHRAAGTAARDHRILVAVIVAERAGGDELE